jgi:hypothetical protein
MHAAQDRDRSAAVDHGHPLRSKVRIEIHPAARDRLIDFSGGLAFDILDFGKALRAQQFLGDKLGRVAQ